MPSRRLETTRWSLVLAAGDAGSPDAAAALEVLCTRYWSPVYGFVRARGHDADAAADFTQAFFTELLGKQGLRHVRPERGRFRSFLLTAVQHFLANEYDRTRAQKRGGGRERLSMDVSDAESRYRIAARSDASPDAVFERDWALSLLSRAMETVAQEYREAGKGPVFDTLRGALTGDADRGSHRAMAASLGTSEGAVSVALHRLRRRYAKVLHEQIAETVSTDAEVTDEIRYLLEVFARGSA